jgi:SAM-dependent methyltransferase
MVSLLPPDYDSDPQRWESWESPQDVHEIVAPELRGPILDVGCGEGRLASLLADGVSWVGVDSSLTELRANRFRPLVHGDMAALPFRDASFAELTHLCCLYHLQNPLDALIEAKRSSGQVAATTPVPPLGTTIRRSSRNAIHRPLLTPRRPYLSSRPSSRASGRNGGTGGSSRSHLARRSRRTAVTTTSPQNVPRAPRYLYG